MEFVVKSCVLLVFLYIFPSLRGMIVIVYIFFSQSQEEEVEGDSNGDLQIASSENSEAQVALAQFWPKQTEEIKKITTVCNI